MKKILTLAVILIAACGAAMAQSGKSIYQKYSDEEGVSAVYISPAMFRIIGKIPDMNIEGEDVNLGKAIKSLTGLYLIDSENASINASLKSEVEKFISGGQYELLLEAKDGGETVRMYTMGDEKTVTGFVMFAVEEGEVTFISIDGKMSRQELEDILAEQM